MSNSTVRSNLTQLFYSSLPKQEICGFIYLFIYLFTFVFFFLTKYLLGTCLGSDTFNDVLLSSITHIINAMQITISQDFRDGSFTMLSQENHLLYFTNIHLFHFHICTHPQRLVLMFASFIEPEWVSVNNLPNCTQLVNGEAMIRKVCLLCLHSYSSWI